MTRRRRDVLRLAGLATAGVAGCLGDGGGGSPTRTDPGSSPTTDPGTATDSPTPGGDDTPTDEPGAGPVASRKVLQLGPESSAPSWYADGVAGHAELYAAAATARATLDLDGLPAERRERVERLVAETDFKNSRLLYLASVGPDTCHDTLEVRRLSVSEGRLVGRFAAVAPCAPDCACGEAVTYPSAMVRVTFDGDPADHARLTAVDGWDEETTVEARADGGVDPADLPGYVRPGGDPQQVAPLSCSDDEFTRHGTGFSGDVEWGEATDDAGNQTMALRVDRLGYARGDEVTVRMTNVSTGEQYTGNRHKYSLQVYTDAGWQDVRGWTSDHRGYTDEAIVHQPGEGFEWTFALTEDGVLAGHVHEGSLTVCPGLPAGRYRFAFWEPAVAVAFDLLE